MLATFSTQDERSYSEDEPGGSNKVESGEEGPPGASTSFTRAESAQVES